MEIWLKTQPNVQISSTLQNSSARPQYVTQNLEMYLDAGVADSYPGSGSTWFDLSGNGRNGTWVSSPSFTSGSISYFSTLGNRCTGDASNSFNITNTSGYTITLAAMQNSLAATGAFHFYSTNGSSGSTSRAIFSHLTWSDDVVYFDQGGCCNTDTRTSVSSGGSQTWNVWTLRKSSNQRNIFKNGSLLATNTVAAANINPSATAVDISGSADYGGNSSTWDARLAVFMVYSRALSDTEVFQNFLVFKDRFSL